MESKAKLFGHPVHPMLIPFPLGLLATSVAFDLIAAIGGYPDLHAVSYWMILAGVLTGLLAAVPGLIDFLAIPRRTRAWFIGMWHGLGNLAVVALFGISWWLRDIPQDPGSIPIFLSIIGAGIAVVTGWLGGELVDRLGVGVDDGAHLNAPNSLTRRPARENDSPLFPPRTRPVEP